MSTRAGSGHAPGYTHSGMRARVYVETTIPSFFHETRTAPEVVARRHWTRHWWSTAIQRYELVTSSAVIDELRRTPLPTQADYLALIDGLPVLDIEPAIAEIVKAYIANHVMPNDPTGDALHLAMASFHKCDFLVTWNCRHLPNANTFAHIRRATTILGLFTPPLVTPLELLENDDENG